MLFRASFSSSLRARALSRCRDHQNRCLAVKPPPRVSSIFFLTSIFNNSIQSSIAVFHLGRISMKNGKGRIATWQPRKRVVRKRRAARKSNPLFTRTRQGTRKRPLLFFLSLCSKPLDCFAVAMALLHLIQAARRDSGLAARCPGEKPCRCAPNRSTASPSQWPFCT
jgi:hypothetical protein